MNGDSSIPANIDSERFREVLAIVKAQVATALWLSAGMALAVAATTCIAFRWRRSALVFGFFYSLTLCFIHNGHAQVLGPAGCAISLAGFLWPVARTRK